MNPPSLRDVATRLTQEGHLRDGAAARLGEILAEAAAPGTPWFVRALVGVSAWLAALLLIIFFSMARIVTSKESALVAGLLLLAGAVWLRRAALGDFARQLALAASLAAQALVIGAFGGYGHSMAVAAAAAIVLQALLIQLYPDKLHRLLSVLIAVGGARVLLVEWQVPGAVHGLTAALSTGIVAWWWSEAHLTAGRMADAFRPLGFGLVLALFALLLPSTLPPGLQHELRLLAYPHPWLSALAAGAVLLVLVWRLLAEAGLSRAGVTALAVYGTILLFMVPALQAPGLPAVLLVLLLGFRRGERLLMGLALAFFAVFLGAYYYHLPVSLLAKSLTLAGSGLVLLVARQLLPRLAIAEARHAQ
jgi:hypothetical protein